MKHALMLVLAWVLVIQNTMVFAKPMDRRAYDLLQIVKAIPERPNQQLTSEEVDSAVSACEIDSVQTRMAAAYLLAFTDSPAGTNALSALATNIHTEIAGVAKFSVLHKHLVQLNEKELLSDLETGFSKIPHPWTRTLTVSWLGDRLKNNAVPFFLAALENEKDGLTRAELFFQVASFGNRDQLAKASFILIQTQEKPDGAFYESAATFLNIVSQNPRKRVVMPGIIKDILDSRLKEMQDK